MAFKVVVDARGLDLLPAAILALEDIGVCAVLLLLCSRLMSVLACASVAHLVLADLLETSAGYHAPLLVRTDPQLGVYLVSRDDVTAEKVTHKQVVVHCLRNDLGDRCAGKLDVTVVPGCSGLP